MNAFEIACSALWAIEPTHLEAIIEIAARENVDPAALEAKRGSPLDNARGVTLRGSVAVVPVTGPIFRYANLFTRISGATSVQMLALDFNAALSDPNVRAVVLSIDSPGGEVNGINEFAGQVRAARAVKPVVAYIGGFGASAAYWIASAAEQVIVDPTAVVGSIGVVATFRDMRQREAAAGIRTVEIVSSQSPDKRPDPVTNEGRAVLQRRVDNLAAVMVDAIAANRGVTAEKVLADFGQGDVVIGAAAVGLGMADAVGDLETVISRLQQAGKLATRLGRVA